MQVAIRAGAWKLFVAAGSGGRSAPTDAIAIQRALGTLQLNDLARDPAELLGLLASHMQRRVSTPGEARPNDRPVGFLPSGFAQQTGSE